MILHAIILGALVIFTMMYCSFQRENKEMCEMFPPMKVWKTEGKDGYLVPNEKDINLMLKLAAAIGNRNDVSRPSVDHGYDYIVGGDTIATQGNRPPEPPPLLHRLNTYLEDPKQQKPNVAGIKNERTSDTAQPQNSDASAYESLPNVGVAPHSYQQLKH